MEKLNAKKLATSAASLAAIWAVSRLLETPRGRKVSKQIDRRIEKAGDLAAAGMVIARRRAARNRGLTVAAVALLAVSLTLFGAATKK